MNKTRKKIDQQACYNRIWSWSPMPCEKHGPRASVTTKTSAFGLGFCLLSPSGHVFHTARETMIKSYNIGIQPGVYKYTKSTNIHFITRVVYLRILYSAYLSTTNWHQSVQLSCMYKLHKSIFREVIIFFRITVLNLPLHIMKVFVYSVPSWLLGWIFFISALDLLTKREYQLNWHWNSGMGN